MPAQDVIKLVLHWAGYGEEGTIGAYFQSAGSHSDSLLNNAAGNIVTNWETEDSPSLMAFLASLLAPAQAYDSLTLYQYNALPGKVSNIGRHALNVAGTFQGSIHPLQTSMVVGLHTDEAGARKRGRVYLPGHCRAVDAATALYQQNTITEASDQLAAVFNSAGASMAGTLNASDALALVVYSPTGGFVTPVTSLVCDNRPDVQRRRAASLEPTSTHSTNYSPSS